MNWLSLAFKALPFVAVAVFAGYGVHRFDSASYARLQARFSQYQAEVAQAQEASQRAASEALQAQAKARTDAESRNETIMAKLESAQHENLTLAASNQFANRLLAAAAKAVPASGSDKAGTASDQSQAIDPATAQRGRQLATNLGTAAAECSDAIERLAALQAELIPQLRRTP